MLWHNFRYTLRVLFKNKMLLFWTYAFPVILGLLFYLAFSNIEESESMDVFDIAIVENDAFRQDQAMRSAFETLGKEGSEEQMFRIAYVDEKKAKSLLSDGDIAGYLLMEAGEEPLVVVKESGINETIFQSVVGEIMRMETMIGTEVEQQVTEMMSQAQGGMDAAAAGNTQEDSTAAGNVPMGNMPEDSTAAGNAPEDNTSAGNVPAGIDIDALVDSVMEQMNETEVHLRDTSSGSLSYTMIEYYTLIAMACLYSAMLGMYAINNVLATMGVKGMRVSVSPAAKWKMVIGSAMAAYVAQLVGLLILFVFTIVVIHVDYGTHIAQVILLALAGSLAGLAMGLAVGACLRTNENTKTGILISVTMAGCFFSGMMGITMKYVIDKNVPLLNRINPANMITDGLYALYYYGAADRYWLNMVSLLVFSVLLLGIACLSLKKQTL